MYICEIKATFTLQVNVGQMDFLLFFTFGEADVHKPNKESNI